jgi:hypothetical protein
MYTPKRLISLHPISHPKTAPDIARAAKVSTGSIPSDDQSDRGISDGDVRRLFEVASALTAEDRRQMEVDEVIVGWIAQQIGRRGLTAVAYELAHDAANLAKVITHKRSVTRRLRNVVHDARAGLGARSQI